MRLVPSVPLRDAPSCVKTFAKATRETLLRAFGLLFLACGVVISVALSHPSVQHWDAQWIWDAGEAAPRNYYLYARRNFLLAEVPETSWLHISADSRYKLFVNGHYLGRGPARSDPAWQQYDSYDVNEQLRTGENVVAVLIHHYGVETGFSVKTRGGLICQLELTDRSGQVQVIGTDRSWKLRQAQAWRRDVDPIDTALGFPEIYNANLDARGWYAVNFDDADWEQATVIPLPERPWTLLAREIPTLQEQEVSPFRVVRVGQVLNLTPLESTDIPEILSREILQEPRDVRVVDPDHLLLPDGRYTLIENSRSDHEAPDFTGVHEASIIADFGRILNGFIRVKVEGYAGQIIDITSSQRLVGGQVPAILRRTANGDRMILRNGEQTWETFEYKNFRYIQLTFRNLYQPLKLDSVSVNVLSHPAEVIGVFDCSDPMLNWLWQACTRTTQLCMDDGYIDNASREKRQWFGDVSTVLLGTYAAMGDLALTHKYFRDAARGQFRDGMLRMFWPGGEVPAVPGVENFPRTIPQHALVWALRVREHYQLYGEREFVAEIYPTLKNLMQWCARHSNEHGLLDELPYWNWLDWSNLDLRGASFATNSIYMKTLQDMAHLGEVLGLEGESRQWHDKAEGVGRSLKELFWSEEKGIYWDSLMSGRSTGRISEHSNYLALLYGLADGHRKERILEALLAPESKMAKISPNFFLYLQYALAAEGRIEEMLKIIRQRFARMYQSGYDTIWEHWTMNGRLTPINSARYDPGSVPVGDSKAPFPHGRLPEDYWRALPLSLSQGACVSPSYVLSTEILGIKPAKPGFRKVRIEPKLGDLQWARGSFPVPQGTISVNWKRSQTEFDGTVNVPSGSETQLVLPVPRDRVETVTLNGQVVPLSSLEWRNGKLALSPSGPEVTVKVVLGR